MRFPLPVLALSALITTCPAYAAASNNNVPGGGLVMTGQELADLCDGKIGKDQPDTFAGGTCLGYTMEDGDSRSDPDPFAHNNVTKGELSDTVVKYMVAHPAEVHRHTASVLAGVALKAVYPVTAACRKATGDSRPVP